MAGCELIIYLTGRSRRARNRYELDCSRRFALLVLPDQPVPDSRPKPDSRICIAEMFAATEPFLEARLDGREMRPAFVGQERSGGGLANCVKKEGLN